MNEQEKQIEMLLVKVAFLEGVVRGLRILLGKPASAGLPENFYAPLKNPIPREGETR